MRGMELETSLTSNGLFQPWTLKLGVGVLQGVRRWDCMGTVGVFPKPSKYLCLKTKNYMVLQKNWPERRDCAAVQSGTSKRKGFKTSG